jgi:chromosome segregation ATPase
MSKKGGKSKKGKKKKMKEEEELPEEVKAMDGATLRSLIANFKEKLTETKSQRNFIQNDRDMVENFYQNTRNEIEDLRMKIRNKETDAEKMEEDHRAEIKMFQNKVKHLEYEQKLKNVEITEKSNIEMIEENEYHRLRLEAMKEDKGKVKQDLVDNENQNQVKVTDQEQKHKKNLAKTKEVYDGKITDLIKKYEHKLTKLKEELELKLKVEIHEIEERKNQHINELMKNHEAAFAELKAYYNDITRENLGLIKAQQEEIDNINDQRALNKKIIAKMKNDNAGLKEPLRISEGKRNELLNLLKQHPKHKMSLFNLKTKLTTLKDKISKLKKDRDDLDERYAKVELEKRQLEEKFDIITLEIKTHAESANVILGDRLRELQAKLETKEVHLTQMIEKSAIDKNVISQILIKIQNSIESRNTIIKNLKYSIHHATKAYNDAIRVYEAKLQEFGIPQEEVGFQTLETVTSMMPAGLVSS